VAFYPNAARAEDANSMSVSSNSHGVVLNDGGWKPDGNFGVVVGAEGTVMVYNSTSTEKMGTGLNLSLSRIAWRPDGSYAIIIGERGTILKFTSISVPLYSIESDTNADLTDISWKPDGSFALITGMEGVMLRFNHDSQRCIRIETNGRIHLGDISWDNNGEFAEIQSDNGTTITYPPVQTSTLTVLVLEPAAGASVSGTFTVRGTASADKDRVLRVEVRLDSGAWEAAAGTDSWSLDIDTSGIPNGVHNVHARAWSSIQETATAAVGINVVNTILPPFIGITSPEDAAALSGLVVISGSASSGRGPVERVDVRLDDSEWGAAVGTESWKVTLDTTTLPNGVHRIQARAWDGWSYSAAARTVTVGNTLTIAPAQTSVPASASQSRSRNEGELTPVPEGTGSEAGPQPSADPGGPLPAVPEAIAETIATADGGVISVPMASGGILLLAAFAAFATEHGKFALFQFLVVPLYSRIKKDRVLDNFTRGMIYGFIMSNPGVHYNYIKQKLGLNNSSIVYHLTVLERQELIKSEKVGLYKRFYPVNVSLSETGLMELSEAQEKLLELVRQNPGLTQRDISERMGLSSRLVNYHVGLLQRSRLVTLEKVGKVTRCYATERMPVC